MQHTGINNGFSIEKHVAYNLSNNNVYVACENHKRKFACILQELNSNNFNIFDTKNECSERVTEHQERHEEQLKTPMAGKYKKKAIEVAKRMALVQHNEIVKSKKGIDFRDLVWKHTTIRDNPLSLEKHHSKRRSI